MRGLTKVPTRVSDLSHFTLQHPNIVVQFPPPPPRTAQANSVRDRCGLTQQTGAGAPGQEEPAAHLRCHHKHPKRDAANHSDGSSGSHPPLPPPAIITLSPHTPLEHHLSRLTLSTPFRVKVCISNRAAQLRPDLRIPKNVPRGHESCPPAAGMVVSFIDECVCGVELASPQVLLIFQQRLGDFSPVGRMVMGCCTSDLSHSCWVVVNSRCGLKT